MLYVYMYLCMLYMNVYVCYIYMYIYKWFYTWSTHRHKEYTYTLSIVFACAMKHPHDWRDTSTFDSTGYLTGFFFLFPPFFAFDSTGYLTGSFDKTIATFIHSPTTTCIHPRTIFCRVSNRIVWQNNSFMDRAVTTCHWNQNTIEGGSPWEVGGWGRVPFSRI